MSETHEGHRARMRARFDAVGVDGFQPHEVIELLLYYAIPQRDVNALAHALIDRFGTVEGVLSASETELKTVPGVGGHAARFLNDFERARRRYATSRFENSLRVLTLKTALEMVRVMLPPDKARSMYALFCDISGCSLYSEVLALNSMRALRLRAVVELALRHRAHSVMVAVRLPGGEGGVQAYGERDVEEANELVYTLSSIGVFVPDYVILHGNRTFSMRSEGKIRAVEDDGEGIAKLYEGWLD